MEKFKEKYLNKIIDKKEYIVLFLVALFVVSPFISNNYVAGNDTDFHMSNIFAIYNTIIGESFGLDKVLPIIGMDYGYGSGIFYPRLAHVVGAYLTAVFAGNVTISLKIVHFLVYFISAIIMYKLVNKVFKNKFVAMLAGIFYITFPYSVTEVFVRDALAESFIYMFMPMILLGLYELFDGNKKIFYIWFIIGYIGMINSHLVLSLYFTAFVCLYLLLNIKKVFTKENFIALCTAAVIILLLTAPFTTGILEHKTQGIYHVFESDSMSNRQTVAYSVMTLEDFLKQTPSEKWSGITYYLNLLVLGLAIVSLFMYKKITRDEKDKKFFIFLAILAVGVTILMSKWCHWGDWPQLIIMIQFVWRLEAVLILALSILGALVFRNIESKKIKVACFIIVLIFNGITVYHAYNFDMIEVHNIEDIDISDWGMGYEKEYLPEVTTQNLEYYYSRGNNIIVPEGNSTKAKVVENNTPYLKAEITNVGEGTALELPRIYYLGYRAELIDNNGNKQNLDLYMNGNGFIETIIDKDGELVLKYVGTTLNKIANITCIITILMLMCFYIVKKNLKNKQREASKDES